MHTIADNCVTTYLQNLIWKKRPRKVGSILNLLLKIPEYKIATENSTGPRLITGSKNYKAGKVMVDMTSGSEAPVSVLPALAKAGINTIISMHVDDEWIDEAERHQINIICAGHISSDTLGMNFKDVIKINQ